MIDHHAKGFPVVSAPVALDAVAGLGWNLFDGRFLLPVMALRESSLDHNIALVADFARRHGMSLAPHGKTTMAPEIFRRQLAAGAWGMTFATAWQAHVGAREGVGRIMIANEVVDPAGIAWLASTLDAGPEVHVWVDSVAGVRLLSAGVGSRAQRLPVLVEVGLPGGRAGQRDLAGALAVAQTVADSPGLRLAGVAFFEGIADAPTPEARLDQVRGLIALARQTAVAIDGLVAAGGGTEIVVTGGGSQYPHVVAEGLEAPLPTRLPMLAILRPGCTVTHDHGGYDPVSPFGSAGIPGGPRLRAALEVWAPVLSVPEPGRAIVGAGKRDLSFDGAPPPIIAIRQRGERSAITDELVITRLNDQHAYVSDPSGRLAVGDLVAIGVRHPCMGLDRWRWLPLVDDRDDVVGAIELVF